MNGPEAVALCRLTKAACPQQQFDSHTPDMWHKLLDDINFEDAQTAMIGVAKRQPFVAPAEIRAEVRRMRNERIRAHAGLLQPPAWLEAIESGEEFDAAYSSWYRDAFKAIADGKATPQAAEPLAIESGEMRAQIKDRMAEAADALARAKSIDAADATAKAEAYRLAKGERDTTTEVAG